jgi:FemAB-related protein (PEP-CTERM system-associated)
MQLDRERSNLPLPVRDALRIEDWHDGTRWDAFVDGAADATIAHRWSWAGIIDRAYGHRTTHLAAVEGDALRGVLPLTLVRSRLFGSHLVSMPYLDYGGVCTDGDDVVAAALVAEAVTRADAAGVTLELRHTDDRAVGLPSSLEKVTMLLELEHEVDDQWKGLKSERRNRIRKGERAGLTAQDHGVEGLDAFYGVLARNMRDLGSPVHAKEFFRATIEALGDRARFLIVRSGDTPVGAALMLFEGDTVWIPYVSSLRAYFDLCPNQVLYWSAIKMAIDEGFRVLDFGRSSRDAGTFEAKRQWRAEPHQLYWNHHPASVETGDDLRRFEWATRAWRRVPEPVARRLGPRIRGGLPQ